MSPSPELLTGIGAAMAVFLSSVGSGVASVPAGKYAIHGKNVFFSFAPIIVSGVLAIYGIIIAVMLSNKMETATTEKDGYKNLSSGLSVGLACLASGWAMSKFMNENLLTAPPSPPMNTADGQPLINGRQPRATFTDPSLRFLAVMTFLEAIGLYGLIVALILQG